MRKSCSGQRAWSYALASYEAMCVAAKRQGAMDGEPTG